MAEHALRKRTVVGSIPTGGSLHIGFVILGINFCGLRADIMVDSVTKDFFTQFIFSYIFSSHGHMVRKSDVTFLSSWRDVLSTTKAVEPPRIVVYRKPEFSVQQR